MDILARIAARARARAQRITDPVARAVIVICGALLLCGGGFALASLLHGPVAPPAPLSYVVTPGAELRTITPLDGTAPIAVVFYPCAGGGAPHCQAVQPGDTLTWTSTLYIPRPTDLDTHISVLRTDCPHGDIPVVTGRVGDTLTLTFLEPEPALRLTNRYAVPDTLRPGHYRYARSTGIGFSKRAWYGVEFVIAGTPAPCPGLPIGGASGPAAPPAPTREDRQ